MRKFLLAAIAALTLTVGLGSAYAAPTAPHSGFNTTPAYADDALGGA